MTPYDQQERVRRPAGERTLRIVYLGMLGEFSAAPLAALLADGVHVVGVIVPAAKPPEAPAGAPIAKIPPPPRRSPLPIANPYLTHSAVHIAWEHNIAAFEVSRLDDLETLSTLADLRPDVACVACFPKRIPAPLLALPPLGFLNLHPSLLPAYRGPAPQFWAFRNGERTIGVTIHFMDEGLDTGDIAAQAPIDLPDGISGTEADRMCAARGARLLVEVIQALRRDTLSRRKQPGGGEYYPWPSPDDFTINTAWPARRAFNFMRGTAEWGQPYVVEVGGARLALRSAIAYTADETIGTPYVRSGREVWVQFTPGVLHAHMGDALD
jgi:methionyl-tRNA formyltransferase